MDENLTGMREHYELLGWQTTTVEKLEMKGQKDKVIALLAKDKDLLLITKDTGMPGKCRMIGAKCFLISDDWIAKKVDEELKKIIQP